MIHLDGMGLVGSVTAWTLREAGVPFTWSDPDIPQSAWRASTGSVSPSGGTGQAEGYRIWAGWHDGGTAPWERAIPGMIEAAEFWFNTKRPPHNGPGAIERDAGALRLGSLPSYHVNVPRLVTATRDAFSADRRDSAPPGSRRVRTTGFGPRLAGVQWGWAADAILRVDPALGSGPLRPCIYLRDGIRLIGYAYPVPGTAHWWAGSSIIGQREPKSLAIPPKAERWADELAERTGGLVRVEALSGLREGWRPVRASEDGALLREVNGVLCVAPLGSSGVRRSPEVARAVLREVSGTETPG